MAQFEQFAGAAPMPSGAVHDCGNCPVRHDAVCDALNDSEIHSFARVSRGVEAAAGQDVFIQGEDAQRVFILVDGAVKIYKLLADGRRQITGFVFRGDFLGLNFNDSYQFSAEALVATKLCALPRRQVENLLEPYPALATRLLTLASHELAAAQNQMVLLGRKTAQEKLASFLLWLAKRQAGLQSGCRVGVAEKLYVPMSRSDIADYLGLTTETVSRTFTVMKNEGLISLPHVHEIILTNREALEDLAEGVGD